MGEAPPISKSGFLSSCSGIIPGDEWSDLEAVFDERLDELRSPAGIRWRQVDTQLRNTIVHARATRWKCDHRRFTKVHVGFSGAVERIIVEAFNEKDPQRREAVLDRGRWSLAEDLSVLEPHSFSRLFTYAVQLKIVERWSAMKPEAGKERMEVFIDSQVDESSETAGASERAGDNNEH
jgi:hypothetical protein